MSANKGFKKADLKVVMVGDACVGKTSLILRYFDRQFQESISTIGASFILKSWGNYNIAIWDTAGSERFTGMNAFYYRNARAAILVFDLTDYRTFENITEKYLPILQSVNSAMLKVIVGTKSDLIPTHGRKVSAAEAASLAANLNTILYDLTSTVPYFETSSKKGTDVDCMFEYVFEHFYPSGGSQPRPVATGNNVTLTDKIIQPKKDPCC